MRQGEIPAAVIDEKIFCVHGGLSPELTRLEQIRRLARPTDVPDTGLLCDFLWSDPDKESAFYTGEMVACEGGCLCAVATARHVEAVARRVRDDAKYKSPSHRTGRRKTSRQQTHCPTLRRRSSLFFMSFDGSSALFHSGLITST